MAAKKISFSQLIKTMRFDRLYRLVQGIQGKKCWQAEFSYGGELHLHFGPRTAYDNPKMAGKSKGAWIFGTCGTPWHLVTPEGSVSSENHREEELEPRIRELEGATVTSVGLSLPDGAMTLYFTNKRRLLVMPTARDRRYDVPYWEIFMPNHRLVAFGPGSSWSSRRSEVAPQRPAKVLPSAALGQRTSTARKSRAGVP